MRQGDRLLGNPGAAALDDAVDAVRLKRDVRSDSILHAHGYVLHESLEVVCLGGLVRHDCHLPPVMPWFRAFREGDEGQHRHEREISGSQDAEIAGEVLVEVADALVKAADEPCLMGGSLHGAVDMIEVADEVVGPEEPASLLLRSRLEAMICTEILVHGPLRSMDSGRVDTIAGRIIAGRRPLPLSGHFPLFRRFSKVLCCERKHESRGVRPFC